jgi:hypothetical protein
MQSYLQGWVHLMLYFRIRYVSCKLSSPFHGLYLHESSRVKDYISAFCLYIHLASAMEHAFGSPALSAWDSSILRYQEYSSLCPGARPLHLLRVEKSRSNNPPGNASLDGDPLHYGFSVNNFPDDGLPYVGLPEIGLQDYLRQGKVAELRQELNSGGKRDKNHSAKKITLKKIVANMTMSNNDMVALFPDIVDCMQIPSLEIKKMYVPR